jgi:hypothetical protein
VFGPISFLLLALAALFLLLPRVTAFGFGIVCAWLALGAGREAFRRRSEKGESRAVAGR